jgi:Zn ribbon nucleic-acid-binding protein
MPRDFKPLEALKAGDWLEFVANKAPKCPHCGEDFDIRENEAWFLYDENGPHDVECVRCGNEFQVSSIANWSFSTDEQEDADA